MVKVSLIVARAANGIIGHNGAIPWYIPEDLKYFKSITLGSPIIMGRKTFESIGKPLNGRKNIIVSGQKSFAHQGLCICNSVAEALMTGAEYARNLKTKEIFVIGGSQIYAAMLPKVNTIYCTEIHKDYEGDTSFDLIEPNGWVEVSRRDVFKNNNLPAYSFVIYDRRM
ncbi:MAG: dihydrofolate reductase [Rhodospirillaceae bacterium]|nr:dihydrofolate reductase [Rhodospirillaceae bacterium]